MKRIIMLLALVAAVASAVPAFAADRYDVDKGHSSVDFTVRHIVSNVKGRFNSIDGYMEFDKAKPKEMILSFTIQTASVDTGNKERDNLLRSPEFFNADDNPFISYYSDNVTAINSFEFEANGTLSLGGTTLEEVILPFTFTGVKQSPVDECKYVLGIESVFSVDRLKYGVGTGQYVEQGVAGRYVNVYVYMELLRELQYCGEDAIQ